MLILKRDNPRPPNLNTARLWTLSQQIVVKIGQGMMYGRMNFPPNKKLGDYFGLEEDINVKNLDLKRADGSPLGFNTVKLIVYSLKNGRESITKREKTSGLSSDDPFFLGAQFAYAKDDNGKIIDPRIVLEINGEYTLYEAMSLNLNLDILSKIYTAVVHEFTHLVDAGMYIKPSRYDARASVKDTDSQISHFINYVNDELEIRAVMREIVEEIKDKRSIYKSDYNRNMESFLWLESDSFRQVAPFLTPKNKKRMTRSLIDYIVKLN